MRNSHSSRELFMSRQLEVAADTNRKIIHKVKYYNNNVYAACLYASLSKYFKKGSNESCKLSGFDNEIIRKAIDNCTNDRELEACLFEYAANFAKKDRLQKDFNNLLVVLTTSGYKFEEMEDKLNV